MAEGRRIYFDDEDEEKYNKLKTVKIFEKNKTNIDLFSLALIIGLKSGIRTPLGDSARGRVRESTINSSITKYLMMAIAVEEQGINVLANEDDYFKISEEYAKTGIGLLESKYVSEGSNLLDSMEMELVEFYDNKKIDQEE
ncbi:hypothetical protein [Methanobrevibacter filiformis]|uniref:DNA sulfur modification protein DndE n=1 Tax=Methanobrevibacter filiformis TaxID=55758 RepID=A0A165ZQS1_9EURY|nr:hypothetical protein [Methanobrevibacter filiformis]KZX11042.1 hypothetical protein MBFIL_15430 [Methanobrevibacter filiformis]